MIVLFNVFQQPSCCTQFFICILFSLQLIPLKSFNITAIIVRRTVWPMFFPLPHMQRVWSDHSVKDRQVAHFNVWWISRPNNGWMHMRARTHACTNTDILRESVLSLAAAKSLSQETLHPLLSPDASHMTFKGGRCGWRVGVASVRDVLLCFACVDQVCSNS